MAKANPLERAYLDADNSSARLGYLFSRLGSRQNPDAPILAAYRNATYALRGIASSGKITIRDARGVVSSVRSQLSSAVMPLFLQAVEDGAASASRQLGYYGYTPRQLKPDQEKIDTVYNVVSAKLQAQETALAAFILGEADESLILGDQDRQGVMKASEIIVTAAYWLAWLFWDAYASQVELSRAAGRFGKQVVAALDHRTTDCCLRAHGQIVPLESKFKLTGTPRFADFMEWTPFHHLCRSSVVLYLPEFDDGLTARMRESARVVLDERSQGKNKYRHPVDAFVNNL